MPDPFVLRTAVPPISSAEGRRVLGVERLGKRVVLELQGDDGRSLFVVIHLMVAGRLRWLAAGAKPPARGALASFAFGAGTLVLTEAGTKRRASIHVVDGRDALAAMDPGGIDVFGSDATTFAHQLTAENHTLKRSLTNPRLFSGIGNAYADEILHRAKLSPITLTRKLAPDEVQRLHAAARDVLAEWTERLRAEAARSRRLARQGDRVSPRDGGARQVPAAVPGVRLAGAAHRARRQRDQLLRALPDRWPAAGRPRAVDAAQGELATPHRRHRVSAVAAGTVSGASGRLSGSGSHRFAI